MHCILRVHAFCLCALTKETEMLLTRAKQVRDLLIKLAATIPLWDLVEQLRQLGYTDQEIRLGIALYMDWHA